MLRIALLGSTGSIGRQTIEVVRHLGPQRAQIVAMTANRSEELLREQARQLGITRVGLGVEAAIEMATAPDVDCVVVAISGTAAIRPVWHAIQAGKRIALANKEVLVTAGELIMGAVAQKGVTLVPIDSEQSALFQCLQGRRADEVARLIVTASGGPFLHTDASQIETITPEQALRHPVWNMGAKNTIDSSTLMNKGLELIEARWLFGMAPEQVSALVHPQHAVHALVELVDGSLIAQVSRQDMRLCIQYALTYPERAASPVPPFDWRGQSWQFSEPDLERFVCLRLAIEAMQMGGTMAGYMNAANEVLVERFLRREFGWLQIGRKLERLMERHQCLQGSSLEQLLEVDQQARTEAAAA
jgi:1-deoxy-D-xylulose-5-phosphate reductoisomerase